MFPYRVDIEWSPEDEAYVARVPALGAAAHGDTMEDAAREAQVASEGMLAVLKGEKRPAPASDLIGEDFSGNLRLRLPKTLHRALAARAAAEGVSLNQLMITLLSLDLFTTIGGSDTWRAALDAAGKVIARRVPRMVREKTAGSGTTRDNANRELESKKLAKPGKKEKGRPTPRSRAAAR